MRHDPTIWKVVEPADFQKVYGWFSGQLETRTDTYHRTFVWKLGMFSIPVMREVLNIHGAGRLQVNTCVEYWANG